MRKQKKGEEEYVYGRRLMVENGGGSSGDGG